MKRQFKRLSIALIASMVLMSNAYASDELWCTGKISQLWINAQGALYINSSWRQFHTQICNVRETWKGITPEVCKSWSSMLHAAKISQEVITAAYFDTDVESCSALPTYKNAPRPTYIMTR